MTETRIEQLEVGDRVVIKKTGSPYKRYVILEVTKTTATQLTIGGDRYNKKTGIRIGDGEAWALRWEIARNFPSELLMSIEEAERANEESKQGKEAWYLALRIRDASPNKTKLLPIETLQQVIRLLGLEGGE